MLFLAEKLFFYEKCSFYPVDFSDDTDNIQTPMLLNLFTEARNLAQCGLML